MSFFSAKETACKCCGVNAINPTLITKLNVARKEAGIPFKINSGYRCPIHNRNVGGSATSSHIMGLAVDISCTNDRDRFVIVKALISAGFRRIGIATSFIHVDIDDAKASAIWFY